MIQNSTHFITVVIAMVASKYRDHTPLYRQAAIRKREAGLEIGRATLKSTGWSVLDVINA
jgi:transposase